MAFTEDTSPFFEDFATTGTLAGVAVRGLLDVESANDFDTITQHTSCLLQPTTAVTAAVGQTLVLAGVTYTVRQVLQEPPDGALLRLIVARA